MHHPAPGGPRPGALLSPPPLKSSTVHVHEAGMPEPDNKTKEEAPAQEPIRIPVKIIIIIMWVTFMSAVLVTLVLLTRTAFSEGAKYLYNVDGDSAAAYPIVDYMLPDNETIAEEQGDYDYMRPDFLYQPLPDYSPPPRVVEFYAPVRNWNSLYILVY